MSLQKIVDGIDVEVKVLDTNIELLQERIDIYDKMIEEITTNIINVIKVKVKKMINEIMKEKSGEYLIFVDSYGDINYEPPGNVSGWEIKSFKDGVVYSYTEGDYPELDKLVYDYKCINDYLTRPLSSGCTYGIIPNRDALQYTIDILQKTKTNINQYISIFGDYI